MNSPPYILVLSSIESVISSGYYSHLFHKLSLQLKTMGMDVTVLSPKSIECKGGKFNTQQLSWLRYCVDQVGGCDIQDCALEYSPSSNRLLQRVQDIVKGSMQIFNQCLHQKPAILQVHQPSSYGLMALPASLIFRIPMILSFGSEQETVIPQSWLDKLILKSLMRLAKTVTASSQQIQSKLKDQLCDVGIVVMLEESPAYFNPQSRIYSNNWKQFIPLSNIHSNHVENTIMRWCQVLKEACSNTSVQTSSSWGGKDIKNILNNSINKDYSHQGVSQELRSSGNRYSSPMINIAYYKKRELQKLISSVS